MWPKVVVYPARDLSCFVSFHFDTVLSKFTFCVTIDNMLYLLIIFISQVSGYVLVLDTVGHVKNGGRDAIYPEKSQL